MLDLKSATLFVSDFVRITDVCCHAPRSGFGEDEIVESPRLIFPRRGVFECGFGRETMVADSNGVLLFNAGDCYRVRHPCDGGDDCSVFVFPPEVLCEALADYGLSRPHVEAHPFAFPAVLIDTGAQYRERMLHHALRLRGLDSLGAEEAAGSLLELLAAQIAGYPVPERRMSTPPQQRSVEQARALLSSRPEARLSLGEIAHQVHYSPFHLARLFRAEVGATLHQYRLRLRLAAALERIAQGEDDLSRLALDLGFDSHSHFTASFKRCFGRTPSQVRADLTRSRLQELRKILIAH
jgi:AraC-like DNA-binding protein